MSGGDAFTLPILLVRSLKYRNVQNIHINVPPTLTIHELKQRIDEAIKASNSLPPPFKTFKYDSIKIRQQAFKSKDPNLVMSLEVETLDDGKTLSDCGIHHETELAYFSMEDLRKFNEDPTLAW